LKAASLELAQGVHDSVGVRRWIVGENRQPVVLRCWRYAASINCWADRPFPDAGRAWGEAALAM